MSERLDVVVLGPAKETLLTAAPTTKASFFTEESKAILLGQGADKIAA